MILMLGSYEIAAFLPLRAGLLLMCIVCVLISLYLMMILMLGSYEIVAFLPLRVDVLDYAQERS